VITVRPGDERIPAVRRGRQVVDDLQRGRAGL